MNKLLLENLKEAIDYKDKHLLTMYNAAGMVDEDATNDRKLLHLLSEGMIELLEYIAKQEQEKIEARARACGWKSPEEKVIEEWLTSDDFEQLKEKVIKQMREENNKTH